jgi:hypothetical protein
MGRKEHHGQIPGQNQNGHLRNSQILKARLDLGFHNRTTNLSHIYICTYGGLGFICLDARKNTQILVGCIKSHTRTEYLSTIYLNPKLNLNVNCIKHYVP